MPYQRWLRSSSGCFLGGIRAGFILNRNSTCTRRTARAAFHRQTRYPHCSRGANQPWPEEDLECKSRGSRRRFSFLRRSPRSPVRPSLRNGRSNIPYSSSSPSARGARPTSSGASRSEEHTSELQSLAYLVCRLLLEKKK